MTRAEATTGGQRETPLAVAQRGLPSRIWQIGCLLGLTVIGGGSTLAWAGGALQAVFTSSEQIATALGIPVLGVVEAGQPRVPMARRLARAALRVAVLFAAASLALAAYLVVLIIANSDSGIAALVSHPIDALADALGRLAM